MRLLIVLAGLPEPEVNLLVGNELERRKYDLGRAAQESRMCMEVALTAGRISPV